MIVRQTESENIPHLPLPDVEENTIDAGYLAYEKKISTNKEHVLNNQHLHMHNPIVIPVLLTKSLLGYYNILQLGE